MKKYISVLLTIVLTIALTIPCFAYDDGLEITIMKENNPVAIQIDGQMFATQRNGQHLEDRYILKMLEAEGVITISDYELWKLTNGLATEKYAMEIASIRLQYATLYGLMVDSFNKGDLDGVWLYWSQILAMEN